MYKSGCSWPEVSLCALEPFVLMLGLDAVGTCRNQVLYQLSNLPSPKIQFSVVNKKGFLGSNIIAYTW